MVSLNTKVEVLDALDWMPFISTGSNLFHLFVRAHSKITPHSTYDLYFRKITLIENVLLVLPLVNLFIKAFHTYRNTKQVILDSCNFNGMNLKSAPYELANDYDVVHAAVSENGLALQFASDDMRKNVHIIKAAVSQNKDAVQFAITSS